MKPLRLKIDPSSKKTGNRPVEIFLTDKPDVLKHISAQAKAPLKDAATVNASRRQLFTRLKAIGLPVEVGSGELTKFNGTNRNLPKADWSDAAGVSSSTPGILKPDCIKPLEIKATRHGDDGYSYV